MKIRRAGGCVIVFAGVLLLIWFIAMMSQTVQVRYFFPADTFSQSELQMIKTRVDGYLEENYGLKDGESSGSTWILEPLPNRNDIGSKSLYFSETTDAKGYSIGASGSRGLKEWAGELKYLFKTAPYEGYEVERTSKCEKSLQFIRSEF